MIQYFDLYRILNINKYFTNIFNKNKICRHEVDHLALSKVSKDCVWNGNRNRLVPEGDGDENM